VTPRELRVDELDLARWIRPGDGVVIGQCCAEPLPLVEALTAQAVELDGVRVFSGMSFSDELSDCGLPVFSYGGLGRTGRIPGLRVVPAHFSALPELFARRTLPGDVAFVQVSPPDSEGRCSYGAGPDYIADAVRHARVVIAEVNARCPRTGPAAVDWRLLDAVVHTDRPLIEAPVAVPGSIEERIAAHVAALVPDGATLQIGVGALPSAILAALRGHRGLRVHSGMICDGVLDLMQSSAIDGAVVTCAALGSALLFGALGDVAFHPVSFTHAPATLAAVDTLCAINGALEVDLDGQVGAEAIGPRILGAVGGQPQFLRAAVASGGHGIVAVPAERIVERLSGPVTTSRADVDWIVTENGAVRLRELDAGARRAALLRLAA
jgi:acyl-CoA hydrolase